MSLKNKQPKPSEGMMRHIEYLKKRGYSYEEMERMWKRSISQSKKLED